MEINYTRVRKQIRTGIRDSDLHVISIPVEGSDAIKWIKENKEFTFKGELYDVVRRENKEDAILFYCLKDSKEKSLIAAFNQKTRREHDFSRTFKKIISQSYVIHTIKHFLFNHQYRILSSYYSFLYKSRKLEIHSPPPDVSPS